MRPPCFLDVSVSPPNKFIRCRGNVFTKPLPSNSRIIRLHCSGFHASCHIAFRSYWTLCFYAVRVVLNIQYVVKGK
jgi:hypothetical protein